jgi:hypothetical protein
MVSGGRVGRNPVAGSSTPRLSLIANPVTGESADIASTSPLINESATMFHDARLPLHLIAASVPAIGVTVE